jgi:hypothetical protein
MYYSFSMTTVSLKLPERLLLRLEEESRARQTTKSRVVRECLEAQLEPPSVPAKPSCYDLAHDLAGSLKGLPRDLATNPRYLQDFGK